MGCKRFPDFGFALSRPAQKELKESEGVADGGRKVGFGVWVKGFGA